MGTLASQGLFIFVILPNLVLNEPGARERIHGVNIDE